MTASTDLRVSAHLETWPLHEPFRIAGYSFTAFPVVIASITGAGVTGRGEAAGIYYSGDTPEKAASQIRRAAALIESGVDRIALQNLLPPGGGRNALDCAFWDYEAKREQAPVWRLADVPSPRPLKTTHTIGVDTPEQMAVIARTLTGGAAFKLKLNGDGLDAARVSAVRTARSDAWLGVDANQSLDKMALQRLMPTLVDCGVQIIEQPFPTHRDHDLDDVDSPIPILADESVQQLSDIDRLVGRFDGINIKLDKCGGLTEGLAMARRARALGMTVMVGNMGGTSLAMGPAFVLGQICDFADLDGPLFLKKDRAPVTIYQNGEIWCADQSWGSAQSDFA